MKRLYSHFPTMRAAWEASASSLMIAGIEEGLANEFIEFRNAIDPERELETALSEGVQIITVRDAAYPPLLKEIYDPPALLFLRGSVSALRAEPLLAVVGARRTSEYGQRVTARIVEPLASGGVGIVSGLALGTDGNAHRAALRAKGLTIAVVGSGVDEAVLYPAEHVRLAREIIDAGGAVISEFPLGTRPQKHFFPMRNRIISGMCRGTLIVEAAATSGALITAYAALDQNREVFAVPGPITSPTSEGTHELLRRGAQLATGADDILASLELAPLAVPMREQRSAPRLADDERLVYELLGDEPLPVDSLIERTGLSFSSLSLVLTQLELKVAIKDVGGKNYIRA